MSAVMFSKHDWIYDVTIVNDVCSDVFKTVQFLDVHSVIGASIVVVVVLVYLMSTLSPLQVEEIF